MITTAVNFVVSNLSRPKSVRASSVQFVYLSNSEVRITATDDCRLHSIVCSVPHNLLPGEVALVDRILLIKKLKEIKSTNSLRTSEISEVKRHKNSIGLVLLSEEEVQLPGSAGEVDLYEHLKKSKPRHEFTEVVGLNSEELVATHKAFKGLSPSHSVLLFEVFTGYSAVWVSTDAEIPYTNISKPEIILAPSRG